MAAAHKQTTRLSTKGQVILPAAIRNRRGWDSGTVLQVEETPDGVLLKAAPLFPTTEPDAVFGTLPWDGPPQTVEDMNAAIATELRQRHDRGRY